MIKRYTKPTKALLKCLSTVTIVAQNDLEHWPTSYSIQSKLQTDHVQQSELKFSEAICTTIRVNNHISTY